MAAYPLEGWQKLDACKRHWIDGWTWEESGQIDAVMRKILIHGEVDGCRTRRDVLVRYEALDRIFDEVRQSGVLKSSSEIRYELGLRGSRDMLIHVGRNSELFIGRGGQHRFAIAVCLGLPIIPAQVGVVHKRAVSQWDRQAIRSASPPPRSSRPHQQGAPPPGASG